MMQIAAETTLNETYQLIDQLGVGGMGEVWRAKHLRLPKEVAVKIITPAAATNAEALRRFRREAEITSQLGHPHIVEIFDFNELADGRPYIVMEMLKGQSLRERLMAGPVMAEEALALLQQVSSALQVAHSVGVVHRDLKPENIFLCDPPTGLPYQTRAKVLDFGISKIQGAQTMVTADKVVMGTPGYMSPEQAQGKNTEVDARTDQFALAAIGYEMLGGQSAFSGSTLAEVIYKVVFVTPQPLSAVNPQLPPAVSAAIDRAMDKDPSKRFSSINDFMTALGVDSVGANTTPPLDRESRRGSASTRPGPATMSDSAPRNAPPVPKEIALAATMATPQSATMTPPQRAPQRSEVPISPSRLPAAPDHTTLPDKPRQSRQVWLLVVILAAITLALGTTLAFVLSRDDSRRPPQRRRAPTTTRHVVDSKHAAALRNGSIGVADVDSRRSDSRRSDGGRSDGGRSDSRRSDGGRSDSRRSDSRRSDSRRSDSRLRRASPDAAATTDRAQKAPLRRSGNKKPPRAAPAPERAEIRNLKQQARAALRQGNIARAQLLGNKLIGVGAGNAGHGVLARAACLHHDLSAVRAHLRNVHPAEKLRIHRFCRTTGFRLH